MVRFDRHGGADEMDEDSDDFVDGDSVDVVATVELAGKRIALAGKLGGMNRREATNLLRSYSATVVDLDADEIDWVVIGAEESPLSESDLLTPRLRNAAASGRVEVLAETDLWQRMGLVDVERSVKRFYTPAMLAELLGVSVRVIRRWHRRGLIIPARTMHKLPYFDFQEVATARRLAELVAAGASPQAIEERLRKLAEVLPEVTRPLAQLSVLIEGRHVLLRQGEGLIEPGGQLRFDFGGSAWNRVPETSTPDVLALGERVHDPSPGGPAPADDSWPGGAQWDYETGPASFLGGTFPPGSAHGHPDDDELLRAVYDFEDRGDLTTAIDYCRAILARDGMRADICFQLGELLYRDGQIDAARERYFCAIELDDTFVEARTSLACVLAETGRPELAVAALRGVLTLHPDYPDAHYHLATILDEQGRSDEAAEHWGILRRVAPDHLWSQPPSDLPPADELNTTDE